MTTDFRRAFEPDAPRELVVMVNRVCAEAEGIWYSKPESDCPGEKPGVLYNPLANYVGDMNNLMRLRGKAIERDKWLFQETLRRITDAIDENEMICAPPWAILQAAYETLKGDKNGK